MKYVRVSLDETLRHLKPFYSVLPFRLSTLNTKRRDEIIPSARYYGLIHTTNDYVIFTPLAKACFEGSFTARQEAVKHAPKPDSEYGMKPMAKERHRLVTRQNAPYSVAFTIPDDATAGDRAALMIVTGEYDWQALAERVPEAYEILKAAGKIC